MNFSSKFMSMIYLKKSTDNDDKNRERATVIEIKKK